MSGPNEIRESELLSNLFKVVKSFVWNSGGDGDGWVISERFQELAEAFEVHEKQNGNWFIRSGEIGRAHV